MTGRLEDGFWSHVPACPSIDAESPVDGGADDGQEMEEQLVAVSSADGEISAACDDDDDDAAAED